MFNLYGLVKDGASLKDVKKCMELLKLVVVDLNEPMGGYDIETVFNELKTFISKGTDADLDENYHLTTASNLDRYFYNKISFAEKDLAELKEKRYEITTSARGEIKHRK